MVVVVRRPRRRLLRFRALQLRVGPCRWVRRRSGDVVTACRSPTESFRVTMTTSGDRGDGFTVVKRANALGRAQDIRRARRLLRRERAGHRRAPLTLIVRSRRFPEERRPARAVRPLAGRTGVSSAMSHEPRHRVSPRRGTRAARALETELAASPTRGPQQAEARELVRPVSRPCGASRPTSSERRVCPARLSSGRSRWTA